MSGGAWQYQSHKIREEAERIKTFLDAVAESESIVDWAVSGDSGPQDPTNDAFAGRGAHFRWLPPADRCQLGHGWCILTAGHPGWCEVASGPQDPTNDAFAGRK